MINKILIFDTTLRDGDQSLKIPISLKNKAIIASLLDEIGVDIIEIGFANSFNHDVLTIHKISKNIKNATICMLTRTNKEDIDNAILSLKYSKKPRINLFISTSDLHIEKQLRKKHSDVLEQIDQNVRYAKSLCDDIQFSAMDSTRSNINFLIQSIETAVKAGATTISIPDTVGYSIPNEYQKLINILSTKFSYVIFSAHCHNDLGLATANTLAGIIGGCKQVECTINGIGERAGNASMDELVMALKIRNDILKYDTNINIDKLYKIAKFVSKSTKTPIHSKKAIVGEDIFTHRSGIHQDGVIKDPNTYELFAPEIVGRPTSKIELGKFSGRSGFMFKMKEYGININQNQLNLVFEKFKDLYLRKRNVTKDDILKLL